MLVKHVPGGMEFIRPQTKLLLQLVKDGLASWMHTTESNIYRIGKKQELEQSFFLYYFAV